MSAAEVYPVRVDAALDAPLSRWLWLVKWLLVIPHYVVLAFLWAGFVVLSAVAWVAILATGRYPRGIFEFNVGVLRWTWRVQYYAIGAFGTDRYPPFRLDMGGHDPGTLTLPPPSRQAGYGGQASGPAGQGGWASRRCPACPSCTSLRGRRPSAPARATPARAVLARSWPSCNPGGSHRESARHRARHG